MRDFLDTWGILVAKMFDFGVNVGFSNRRGKIFELNGGFGKRNCVIFGIKGRFLKRKCVIFA